MADIKTRDTVKGTIKTLDKAAVAGQKMKQAYISARDIAKAEGVAHQVVDRHILAAKKKVEKIFGNFFRK